MPYVPRDQLVGCEVSLIGPARTVGGVDLADGTRGTVIALKGRHGARQARVRVRTEAGVEFECRRKRLHVIKRAPETSVEPT